MFDCLIIGAGVIGLSLAYELARQGLRVQVLDRGELGREASWAGAGILPPANRSTATHPYEQLCGLSCELHPVWADRLREETGIDTGYRRCGGLYLARSGGEAAALAAAVTVWREERVRAAMVAPDAAAAREPGIADAVRAGGVVAACLLPDEAQLRNPWHLKALQAACRNRGVPLQENAEVDDVQVTDGVVRAAIVDGQPISAGCYVVTSGAWSYRLLNRVGVKSGILPVRGQMVLYACRQPPLRHILNLGPRYLVPREDGRVLVGSTEEEVGFDKRTTEAAIDELKRLACDVVPALREAMVEATWAGLRPGSFDGFPYLGRVPNVANLYVAAGHFRSGLFLSTGTAVVMSQLIQGLEPEIDLTPLRVGRG